MLWANANIVVSAQIKSNKAYANLDSILAAKGLTLVASRRNDFAASLAQPASPSIPSGSAWPARSTRVPDKPTSG